MRKAFSTKLNDENIKKLIKLSDITRIPQSKLVDEALELLFKKHSKNLKDYSL